MVVERARLLVEEQEVGRAQRHLVGGAQGLVEAATLAHLLREQRDVCGHLRLAHGAAEDLRQEGGEEAAGIGLGLRGDGAQVLARRLGVGRPQRQVSVEQTMSARGPFLLERTLDVHPFDHRADAGHHGALIRFLRDGAVGREPERLAARHARLVGELPELRGAHLEVGVAEGQAGARPVGERHLQDDVTIGPGGVVLAGVGPGLVDHRLRPDAEAVACVRHRRGPGAEFAVRTVAPAPADGEQALG